MCCAWAFRPFDLDPPPLEPLETTLGHAGRWTVSATEHLDFRYFPPLGGGPSVPWAMETLTTPGAATYCMYDGGGLLTVKYIHDAQAAAPELFSYPAASRPAGSPPVMPVDLEPKQWQALLGRLTKRIGRPTAEDMIQKARLALFKEASARTVVHPLRFVRKVLSRRLIDERRRQKRRPALSLETQEPEEGEAGPGLPGPKARGIGDGSVAPDPEARARSEEVVARVYRVFQKLARDGLQAIVLQVWGEELDVDSEGCGRLVGVSGARFRKRLQRGRDFLRDRLPHGFFAGR